MKRSGEAIWRGILKTGAGQVSTQSRYLDNAPYSYVSRFERNHGTNPEELIAAAHAGCFSMQLAAELEKDHIPFSEIQTLATFSFEKSANGWGVEEILLNTKGVLDIKYEDGFLAAAARAKESCPVSRLLKANIILQAMVAEAEVNEQPGAAP